MNAALADIPQIVQLGGWYWQETALYPDAGSG
jgi:hypothetical protein